MANTTADDADAQTTTDSEFDIDYGFDERNNAATLSSRIHGNTLEVPLRHIAGVVDSGRVQFDGNGVYTKAIGEDKVCMVRSFIPSDTFNRYSLIDAGTEGFQFDRVTANLRKMKTRLRTRDTIDMAIRTDESGDKFLSLSDIKARTVSIPLLDAGSIRATPSLPDLDLSAAVDIHDGNRLREFFNDLPRRGAVSITASSPGVNARSNGVLTVEHWDVLKHADDPSHADRVVQDTLVLDGDDVSIRPWGDSVTTSSFDGSKYTGRTATDAHRGNVAHVTSYYTTEYLKQWCDDLRKTRTEGVRYLLRFGHEFPMKLSRQDDTGIITEFMAAPRIMNA